MKSLQYSILLMLIASFISGCSVPVEDDDFSAGITQVTNGGRISGHIQIEEKKNTALLRNADPSGTTALLSTAVLVRLYLHNGAKALDSAWVNTDGEFSFIGLGEQSFDLIAQALSGDTASIRNISIKKGRTSTATITFHTPPSLSMRGLYVIPAVIDWDATTREWDVLSSDGRPLVAYPSVQRIRGFWLAYRIDTDYATDSICFGQNLESDNPDIWGWAVYSNNRWELDSALLDHMVTPQYMLNYPDLSHEQAEILDAAADSLIGRYSAAMLTASQSYPGLYRDLTNSQLLIPRVMSWSDTSVVLVQQIWIPTYDIPDGRLWDPRKVDYSSFWTDWELDTSSQGTFLINQNEFHNPLIKVDYCWEISLLAAPDTIESCQNPTHVINMDILPPSISTDGTRASISYVALNMLELGLYSAGFLSLEHTDSGWVIVPDNGSDDPDLPPMQ